MHHVSEELVVSGITMFMLALALGGCNGTTTTDATDPAQESQQVDADTGTEDADNTEALSIPSQTETVYYEEPSLEDLPAGITAEDVEEAIRSYIKEHYPNRVAESQELIGEFTNGDENMWACYVVRLSNGEDIGLEVTYSHGEATQVTEERYLKSANGMYYDIQTKEYVTDLQVFGNNPPEGTGDVSATEEHQDAEQPTTPVVTVTSEADEGLVDPSPTAHKPVRVIDDKGNEVFVKVDDLEP